MFDTKSKKWHNQKSWGINVGDRHLVMHSRFPERAGYYEKKEESTDRDLSLRKRHSKRIQYFFSTDTLQTQLIGAALMCCGTAVKNRWTRKAHKGLGFLQPDACCYYWWPAAEQPSYRSLTLLSLCSSTIKSMFPWWSVTGSQTCWLKYVFTDCFYCMTDCHSAQWLLSSSWISFF